METPKVKATQNAGLQGDHDPKAVGQAKDEQKPQWKQAEGRTAAEKNLKPKKVEGPDDNPHDV